MRRRADTAIRLNFFVMHLPGVPPDVAAQIQAALQRPEATFTFNATLPGLIDPAVPGGVVLEVVAGAQVLRLHRDADLFLHFIHSSPGTGTRLATLNLNGLDPTTAKFFFALSWSPEQLLLHVGCYPSQGGLLTAEGETAPYELHVGTDGSIVRVGAPGVQVAGVRVFAGGVQTVSPSAIKLWQDTRMAAETLLGVVVDNYLQQVVTSNAVVSWLATGFETYLQKRFTELDAEGVPCDVLAVARSFLSKPEREALDEHGISVLQDQATADGTSVADMLAGRINFQSYDNAKRAYNRGYGLKFGDAASSSLLEEVQQLLGFRHRVIHVSPILSVVNQPRVPPDQPIFSNVAFAQAALATMDKFVMSVHKTTLTLRPPAA